MKLLWAKYRHEVKLPDGYPVGVYSTTIDSESGQFMTIVTMDEDAAQALELRGLEGQRIVHEHVNYLFSDVQETAQRQVGDRMTRENTLYFEETDPQVSYARRDLKAIGEGPGTHLEPAHLKEEVVSRHFINAILDGWEHGHTPPPGSDPSAASPAELKEHSLPTGFRPKPL